MLVREPPPLSTPTPVREACGSSGEGVKGPCRRRRIAASRLLRRVRVGPPDTPSPPVVSTEMEDDEGHPPTTTSPGSMPWDAEMRALSCPAGMVYCTETKPAASSESVRVDRCGVDAGGMTRTLRTAPPDAPAPNAKSPPHHVVGCRGLKRPGETNCKRPRHAARPGSCGADRAARVSTRGGEGRGEPGGRMVRTEGRRRVLDDGTFAAAQRKQTSRCCVCVYLPTGSRHRDVWKARRVCSASCVRGAHGEEGV
ncbi:hypothetical protein LMXM_08_29_0555 [Leishmania mexicana MHOM/GT/2001/U1103]|uniref:Uncharacterized protein n=1 Tax=Leishmania mexicana (strain MHOM/GT/2001/U1103) TaxID=929439 RepID=E9AM23_LEIMU|nr:hypothetical protein LMXM_08_29_0555 [Leishmania mexicana MHOM/GT/2001/U1103]CBZ23978.1 hypothetical protein LMXM_08_29_0555 [Leishmania mexicana MHOM/GT/2001/U1103]